MEVFYAFCRVIDDLADDPELSLSKRKTGLESWRAIIDSDTESSAGVAGEVIQLKQKYQLSNELLHQIIDGVEMDLEPLRFETHDDLKRYCFHVASAVGLVSIEIFGYQNPSCIEYAKSLGYALQWTNILRDVGEDSEQQRIYLPLASLAQHQISESDILNQKVEPSKFLKLMQAETVVARQFYAESLEHLADEDRPAMKSPELMRTIYTGILDAMEADNYQVFTTRYRLSKPRMLLEFLKAKFS